VESSRTRVLVPPCSVDLGTNVKSQSQSSNVQIVIATS
jgi:hypothetical protein